MNVTPARRFRGRRKMYCNNGQMEVAVGGGCSAAEPPAKPQKQKSGSPVWLRGRQAPVEQTGWAGIRVYKWLFVFTSCGSAGAPVALARPTPAPYVRALPIQLISVAR